MAQQDARIFRLLFEPRGAIDQFKEKPDRHFVVIRGYFIAKKPILRLVRHLLPAYRVYQEDNELVEKLYANKKVDLNLRRLINPAAPPVLNEQQATELETALKDKLSDPDQKEDNLNKWLNKLEGKVEEAALKRVQQEISKTPTEGGPPPQTPSPPNIPRPKWEIPSSFKDFSSHGQILTRRLGENTLRGAGSLVRGVGSGLFQGLGGAGRAGGMLTQGAARGAVMAGGAAVASVGWPIVVAVLIVVAVIFIGPLIFNILESGSFIPPYQKAEAGGIGNINSCQFYRGDRNPQAESYQSPLLLSYFQEAETLTSVPSTLLAAIARVETPSVTKVADADLPTLGAEKCPINPTGALGIMQIQPPWGLAAAYSASGVEKGASFLNKTVDQLTQADFCDPRGSIILSAGLILSKLGAVEWNPSWTSDQTIINRVAEGYYGCLEYGTSEKTASGTTRCAGPYNYGDDLWNSLQNCRPVSVNAPPPSTDQQKLHDDILNAFGINMDTAFGYNYLKWAWEKLWGISNTKFLNLVNPNHNIINIRRLDRGFNEQISCNSLTMSGVSSSTKQPYSEGLFKVVFIHELSHIIENCYPQTAKKNELQSVISQEGYLTSYSQNGNSCIGGINNLSEDYAETITYFLNLEFPEQSLGIGAACEPAIPNNPYQRSKPLHQQFARELLVK
ncbi:MAG: hypothetical protein HYW45_01890 [Candidatus Daviesbacteria bacterium]|nr:MAG: hypothetical protein HYW45_01890 [Candidatus Daviesbacteria bacterium]